MDSRVILGAAAAVGLIALTGKKRGTDKSVSAAQKVGPNAALLNPSAAMSAIDLPRNDWPEMVFDVPFAAGVTNPVWPIVTNHSKKYVVSYMTIAGKLVGNGARRFMANRGEGKYHVGIDVYASHGDPVLAMEDGTIVNHYHFYHGSYALIVQCDSGLVINYGEVAKDSWKEFGLSKGSRVKRGHGIARIGTMSGGSSMLHFETYMPPTDKNKRYYGGSDTGPFLNPTYYLLLAKFREGVGGRAFASADCAAMGSRNRPIPEEFLGIAEEEKFVDEKPVDSVLTELLVDDMYRPDEDKADGP